MAITRYRNPWQDLDQLTNRLSRMFDDREWPRTPSGGGDWLPSVNVEEDADEILLTAELPGMSRDDVEIELENNILTIRGQKQETRTEGEERRYHVWERRFGTFQRSFTLPRTVRGEDISAEFESGVLHVHMPKAPEAKGRRIEIAAGSEA